jgi:glycogen(starch) synthase
LKICILVHNNIVHDPRVIKQADVLAQAGHEVTVVGVRNPGYLGEQSWIAGKQWKAVWYNRDKESVRGRLNWFKTAVRSHLSLRMLSVLDGSEAAGRNAVVTAYPELLSLALSLRPDVYHANELNMLPVACEAARRNGAQVVYDSHEFYTNENDNMSPAWERALLSVEGKYIKRADAVTTVSDSIADELHRIYGIARPLVIRNMPSVEEIPAGPKRDDGQLRVLYSLYLVSPGYNRGINQIIESAPHLDEKVHITIRGRISEQARQEIEALISKYGAASRVSLAEAVDPKEVVRSAAAYDVGLVLNRPFCLSFLYSLPTKLFEYLMAGLAVVGFDVPEVRRVLSDSAAGRVCEPEPRALAEALNLLARDRDYLSACKSNARRAALEKYNWDVERLKLLSLYENFKPRAGKAGATAEPRESTHATRVKYEVGEG